MFQGTQKHIRKFPNTKGEKEGKIRDPKNPTNENVI
jgi:hypothetical protein